MKLFSFLIFFVFIFKISFSQINVDSITANNAYKPGEKLVYSVKYGVVKGGEASLTIDIIPSGETFYYYVKAKAVTTGLASNLARIYDVYESYINISTGYPVKSVRNITENNYTRYDELFFYRSQNYVYSINSGKHYIPANAHDILSAFYFARRNLFKNQYKKGEIIDLTTFFDNQLLPIKIKYKETENISTNFGKINAIKFVPILEKNNPFKKEDDLQIWFSNDGNYVPLRLKMKSKIGNINAELIFYENLKNPLGSKNQ